MCGCDQMSTKISGVIPTVKHGSGNVMSAAGVGELYFIEGNMNSNMYCEILHQSMISSLQKLGCRAVFQHNNDPKHTSKTTTALLKSKGDGLAKHVSRLEPERTSLVDPQAEISNIHQLCDIVMEEWKSIPVGTCEALVNSMHRRVKAVLDNDGGHTKY